MALDITNKINGISKSSIECDENATVSGSENAISSRSSPNAAISAKEKTTENTIAAM
jgi:hypothetical protein